MTLENAHKQQWHHAAPSLPPHMGEPFNFGRWPGVMSNPSYLTTSEREHIWGL